MILTIQGTSDLFLDLELEVTETAAAGLPLRGSQMDATIRDSDGSGKCDLFLIHLRFTQGRRTKPRTLLDGQD